MTTVTCDVCGKQIKDFRENWDFSLTPHVGIPNLKYGQEDLSLMLSDVCQDCASKIHEYVANLKDGLDKDTSI